MRRRYGSGPAHLALLLASLGLATLGIAGWFAPGEDSAHIVAWFFGALIVHDFLLLPAYSLIDRRLLRDRRPGPPPGWTLFLRVPTLLSGLLLLVFAPFILGWRSSTYQSASGLSGGPFLGRWLVASGVMYGVAGLCLLAGRRRRGGGGRSGRSAQRAGGERLQRDAAPLAAPQPPDAGGQRPDGP